MKQLKREKKRLLAKEIFLKDKITESLSFLPGISDTTSRKPRGLKKNSANFILSASKAMPKGILRTIVKRASKYSWLIPLLFKYAKRLL